MEGYVVIERERVKRKDEGVWLETVRKDVRFFEHLFQVEEWLMFKIIDLFGYEECIEADTLTEAGVELTEVEKEKFDDQFMVLDLEKGMTATEIIE